MLQIFLKNGGIKNLPCKTEILMNILSLSYSKVPRIVGYFVSFDTRAFSPIAWHFIIKKERNEEMISFISSILSVSKSLIVSGSSEFNKRMIKACIDICNPKSSFSALENALIVLQWLISLRLCDPLFLDVEQFENSSIALLVLKCYAEYATYCDLSKIPEFKATNDPILNKGFSEIFRNAMKNPKFEFGSIYVPHWFVDAIYEEFIPSYVPKLERKSLQSLSNEELFIYADIAHVFPGWFFTSVLRTRTHNLTTLSIYLRILETIPIKILDECFDEFIDFVIYCTQFQFENHQLLNVVQSNIIAFACRDVYFVDRIVSETDFFNPCKLENVLEIITPVIRIIDDEKAFIEDIVDKVLEVITLIKKSSLLCREILSFLSAAVRKIKFNKIVFQIALGLVLIPLRKREIIKEFSDTAQVFIESCIGFYSLLSSDLVTNPNYEQEATYSMTPYALSILINMKIYNAEYISFVLRNIPNLLCISPIEAISFAIVLSKKAIELQMIQELQHLSNSLYNVIYTSQDLFVSILTFVFQESVSSILGKNSAHMSYSGAFELSNDIGKMRNIIMLEKGTLPLVASKSALLPLLLEDWCDFDMLFFDAINVSLTLDKDWRSVRQKRIFLKYFGIKQPTFIGLHSWVYRDFFGSKVEINKKYEMPIERRVSFADYQQFVKSKEFLELLSKNMLSFDYNALKYAVKNKLKIDFPEDFENPICKEVFDAFRKCSSNEVRFSESKDLMPSSKCISQITAFNRKLFNELQEEKGDKIALIKKRKEAFIKANELIEFQNPVEFFSFISTLSTLVSIAPKVFNHTACSFLSDFNEKENFQSGTVETLMNFIPFFMENEGTKLVTIKLCKKLNIKIENGVFCRQISK